MKPPKKLLTLTIFFALLTLIAAATVIAVHQTPEQQTTTNAAGTYTSTAKYDYTAALNPSTLYGNKTALKPNEGTLYTKITQQIDLTLYYTFDTTLTTTTTNIQYTITRTLKTDAWQYQMSTTPQENTDQKIITIHLPTFSKGEIEPIKARIDNETGGETGIFTATSPYYTMEISPTFTITANTQEGTIHQTFNPTLTISSNRTDQGDVITINGLYQTQTGQLTTTQTTVNQDTMYQRYVSYILITVSITGLTISMLFYKKQKTNQPKPQTEKLIATHKDLIIEATKNTEIDALTTINLTTANELIKTAEILAKPIIHTKDKNEKHVFYIIDDYIKYQYQDDSI